VILPLWDVIFRTRRPDALYLPTGVAALEGREVRCGYLRHQIEGFRRLGAALIHRVNRRRSNFTAAFPAE
jgi:hypothetical protein